MTSFSVAERISNRQKWIEVRKTEDSIFGCRAVGGRRTAVQKTRATEGPLIHPQSYLRSFLPLIISRSFLDNEILLRAFHYKVVPDSFIAVLDAKTMFIFMTRD